MKHLARVTVIVVATLLGVLVLWEFRESFILFIFSLVIAAVLRPIVDRLTTLGLPRIISLLLTYIVMVALFVGLVIAIGGPLLIEIQTAIKDLPGSIDQIRTQWLNGNLLQQTIARNLQDLTNLLQTGTGSQLNVFAQNLLGITLGSLNFLSKTLVVIALSIYWSADHEHFMRLWLSLLPSDWRTRAWDIWQHIEHEIGSYLRSEVIQSLLTVVFLGLGYQLIGLKYPVTLALVGAIGWLIVWIGGVVAVVPALLVGLSVSLGTGVAAAVFTIAVLAFLEFVVEPRLFDRQRTSSLLVVIVVLIMVEQNGLIGFLLAPPLAAALQIFAHYLVRPTVATPGATVELEPPPNIKIDLLRDRLSSLQSKVAVSGEPPAPELVNLLGRLDDLIDRANQEEI